MYHVTVSRRQITRLRIATRKIGYNNETLHKVSYSTRRTGILKEYMVFYTKQWNQCFRVMPKVIWFSHKRAVC